MSPEQIRGGITKEGRGGIDGRSDLYAVGVLLYQLLTGSLPFKGMNKMGVLAAHLHSTIPAMKDANPAVEVPPQVERLVMKCLEKDPDLRPQSARELAEQFRAAILPEEVHCPRATSLAESGRRGVGRRPALGCRTRCPGDPKGDGRPGPYRRRPHNKMLTRHRDPNRRKAKTTSQSSRTEPLPSLVHGYVVADNIKLPKDAPPGATGLRRTSDNVEFYPLKTGAYLPVGYEPDPNDTDDLVEVIWPRVIVRTSDRSVRFIRIPSKTYRRGDPHSKTGPEPQQWVRVSGFYIQETEVTNGEIEAYLESHFEAEEDLRNWREYFKLATREGETGRESEALPRSRHQLSGSRTIRPGRGRPTAVRGRMGVCRQVRQRRQHLPLGEAIPQEERTVESQHPDSSQLSTGLPTEVQTFPDDKQDDGVFDMAGNVREFCLDVFKPYPIVPPENSPEHPLLDPRIVAEPQAGPYDQVCRTRGGMLYAPCKKQWRSIVKGSRRMTTAADIGFRVVIECPPVPSTSY